jgi:hypothetical protein
MDKGNNRYGKKDPLIANCRTRFAGAFIPGTTLPLYYCNIDEGDCKYARSLGYDYLCKHIDSHSFAIDEMNICQPSP